MVLGDFLNGLIQSIIAALPQDPFQVYLSGVSGDWVGWLNWFIPVKAINRVLAAWITAVLAFYAYQAIARWMHLIR